MTLQNHRLWRLLLTLLPALAALLLATGFWRSETLQRLDAMAYDARLQVLMPRTLDSRVVIVDIDEASLSEIGRWPWSRHHLARLVDALFEEQQVAVLGFDVVFAEADTSSGLKHLQSLAKQELRGQAGFSEALHRLAPELDYDARFAAALQDRPVVLGYYFTNDRDGRRSGQLPPPVIDLAAADSRRFSATGWDGYGSNIDPLATAAPLAGFFNPIVDADGRVRTLPLLVEHDGQYYESLALAIFRQLMGQPEVKPGFSADLDASHPFLASVNLVQNGLEMAIPVDQHVASLVPFRGPGGPKGGSYTYLSAADVIKGRLPAGMLEGSVVLLGTTAPGLMDLRATPVNEVYPGVELHANLISGLLDGALPVVPDYAVGADMFQIVVCALLLALVMPRLKALPSTLFVAALVASIVGLNFWLYASMGLALPLVHAVLMVALVFVLDTLYGYFFESRSKRELAHLFGSYVPPELVDEMVKAPEQYSMKAVERELTVMFSDMRGFTHLSETMNPQDLQNLLNQVFTKLSQCIRQQGGTIDKFMGDCVMAFWGAPVLTPDHARRSLEAALDMRLAIIDINTEQQRKHLPSISMGIGLNTGLMAVGDMGSDIRRSYTVIGDAVNLGSRLEGLGKHYGVDIVVSEATRVLAGDGFVWKELDRVRVKGKDESVTIHALLGKTGAISETEQFQLPNWADFLVAYRSQRWPRALDLLTELLGLAPNSMLYLEFQSRIAEWQQNPPPPDWDGSWRFDSK